MVAIWSSCVTAQPLPKLKHRLGEDDGRRTTGDMYPASLHLLQANDHGTLGIYRRYGGRLMYGVFGAIWALCILIALSAIFMK